MGVMSDWGCRLALRNSCIIMLYGLTACAQGPVVPPYANEPLRAGPVVDRVVVDKVEVDKVAVNTAIMATVIPVVESMAGQLVKDTPVSVSFLPPPKYSIKRVPGWLKRQPTDQYSFADVVVGISAVWPEVDVYPALRSQNIHVIPVDLAHALTPGGERVAVVSLDSERLGYFWLNASNALLMLGVMSRDLSRIWPEYSGLFQKNAAEMGRDLRAIQIGIDDRLLELGVVQVVIENENLADLAAASMLPVVSYEEAVESHMNTLYISAKKRRNKKPLPENFRLWLVDDFSKIKPSLFIERWNLNLKGIPLN
ncbi:hypothetical protein [Alkalimarinus alittae]|uniref:ABC transporter substrate-binding protein n=1 Tax=Alkalimarinus alittae TaxID=2961619 RepID=A0ABY6N521_9ALTE|nr:hypothetical protein [Alkalimarinus alittae]UZE97082.1 hypothetical protein NKI27_04850 [Alkalimarinus alittae]